MLIKLLLVGLAKCQYSDEELLLKLKEGDQYIFKMLYERYRPNVYRTALRYLKSVEQAEEVVQDIFMRLWMERADLPQLLSLEAWLYRLVKNDVLNRLKRQAVEWKAKQYFSNTGSHVAQTTLDQLKDREYAELLKEVLETLPQKQREVFDLARDERLTYAEIADKMAISPLTVKTHMARALQHIRDRMTLRGVEIPIVFLIIKNFF